MASESFDLKTRLLAEPPEFVLPQLLLQELRETQEFFNQDSDSQFSRRILYRNSFAYVEGMLHFLKTNSYSHYVRVVKPVISFWKETVKLDFPEEGFVQLVDDDVLLALLEKKISITEKGDWRLKEDWLPTATNVRFTFKIIAKIYGIAEMSNAFADNRWNAFQRCVETRNRVTHPKMMVEFDVLQQEILDLEQALNWFQEQTSKLMEESCLAFEWNQQRVQKLTSSIPEERRAEVLTILMEKLGLSWDEIKREADEQKEG